MAWQKIPTEHHALFLDALPSDSKSRTLKMFGGLCAMANGHMYSGLWADTAIVRLGDPERSRALKLKGAVLFDPMEKGRPMKDMVVLPASTLRQPEQLKRWFLLGFEYASSLPPKKTKGKSSAQASRGPARKRAAR